ncbi:hypothetical protein N1851_006773 [Merluccius polli]|uniref:Uncharacterized protein n=1 Tax=Merluccius polli TaxID=89951 RepID=A0AA47N4S8_MERPO|nr:hypothetical protein N1851_006773 [Merluccius polli]
MQPHGSTPHISRYKFCKKPTTVVHYKGLHLKRLLEQRWTGLLAHCVSDSKILRKRKRSLLTEVDTVLPAYGAEMPTEAAGLLREMTVSHLLPILALLDPPNKLLQREDTDFLG